MVVFAHAIRGAGTGLAALLLGAVVVAGCNATFGASAAADTNPAECYRIDEKRYPLPDVDRFTSAAQLREMFDTCRQASANARQISERANARLRVGLVGRRLAQLQLAGKANADPGSAARSDLDVADDALRGAMYDLSDLRTLEIAKLELARVLRLKGDTQGGLDLIERMDRGNLAARYERGLLLLDRSRGKAGEAALLDREEALKEFTQFINNHDLALARDARTSIVREAGALGSEAERGGAFQRARTAYQLAVEASVNNGNPDPALFIRLGGVIMHMAGVNGPNESNACALRPEQKELLSQALREFGRASSSAEARQWAGCADLAMGEVDSAINEFRSSISLAPNDSNGYMLLASAHAAAGNWSEANAQFQRALNVESDPRKQARIRIQIGKAYLNIAQNNAASGMDRTTPINSARTNFEAAERVLLNASDRGDAYADALIGLGRIYLDDELGDFSGKTPERRDLAKAQDYLSRAKTYAAASSQRAQAQFYLSRHYVRVAASGPVKSFAATGADAVSAADEAFRLEPANRDYRQQACLARIAFGRVSAGEEGTRFCIDASEGKGADSLLYEGMFRLRLAHSRIGGDRKREWENALRAFTDGLEAPDLDRAARAGDARPRRLRARLLVGKGVSFYCSGLAGMGGDAIDQGLALDGSARDFFQDYRVRLCEG